MKWKNSLVFKFWIYFNTIVLTATLTISALYLWRENVQLENSLKNEGLTAANTLNSVIGLFMLQENYSQISPLTYSLQDAPNIAYVIVRDTEGVTVNQKGNTLIDKNQILIEKVPLQYFQEDVGEIEIAMKTETLEEQKLSLLKNTIIIVVIFSFITLILSYYISKRLLQPIKRLITATKQFTEGNRNIKVYEKNSVEEFEQLATAFNHMSETINSHEQILINEIEKATKDLSEKVATLEILSTISNSVLLEDDIQSSEVIAITLESIKKHIHVDMISYAFYDNNEKLQMMELKNDHNIFHYEIENQDAYIQDAINQKEIVVRNINQSNDLTALEEMLTKKGMQSALIFPVIAKNRVIGTLNMASKLPDYFTEEIIHKLSPFTNQIALGLDRIAAYETLQYSAYHDFLTGLPNYRSFMVRLTEILENTNDQQNALAAILVLNLDRFKLVNDTFGRMTGDYLLKHFGRLLSSVVSSDVTVARFGGDEFSMLLPTIKNHGEAVTVAENILSLLEKPIIINGYEMTISTSIGIAFYPNNGLDAETLLTHANRAMNRAKKTEKNKFAIYAQHKDDHSAGKLILENDIRKGLENEEFLVYYQPKVDVSTGKVSGAEALVRWIHPEKGMISPGEFIPLAEENGLITSIGEFVLHQAANQIRTWQTTKQVSIPISVNLSTRQFFQPTLVQNIEKIIIETGIAPELLELEITESTSMEIESSLSILLELKRLGVQISVDDFGTGYSSLNYLRQLPIDRVKIDKSFINDMTIDENNEAIVATIINMSHNLKLGVIAEGVETEEQLKCLQKYHCDEVQGYYYSKPVPADEFEHHFIDTLAIAIQSTT